MTEPLRTISYELERLLNERRDVLRKDHVYLTRFARPLDEAIGEAQTHDVSATMDPLIDVEG